MSWLIAGAILLVFLSGLLLGVLEVMSSQCNGQFRDALIKDRADGIHFDGTITQKSIVELLAVIGQSKSPEPTVWLASGGGDVDVALYFALMVAQRPIRMAVGRNAMCASSCVLLFLAGQKRFADPTAGFLLHGVFCPGTLANLECLAERGYISGADRYQMFMAQRASSWYKKAIMEQAFDYPPERLLCYTFPNGADTDPVNEHESNEARGNCAMVRVSFLAMQPEFREHASCPIGTWQRVLMIGKWLIGMAEKTSRHSYPQ